MLNIQASTVVFQVLNFLVLMAVLRWFFYRPVLEMMKARQTAITAKLKEAEELSRQAEVERQTLAEQIQDAQRRGEELLARAQTNASKAAEEIVTKAHAEASQLLAESQQSVAEAQTAALDRAERAVRDTALTMAGDLIRQSAGPAVHAQLLDRLLSSDDHARALHDALGRSRQLTIEVAYPAAATQQAEIVDRLAKLAGVNAVEITPEFETQPELLAGARILAGDLVLDLSLQRTLRQLATASEAETGRATA